MRRLAIGKTLFLGAREISYAGSFALRTARFQGNLTRWQFVKKKPTARRSRSRLEDTQYRTVSCLHYLYHCLAIAVFERRIMLAQIAIAKRGIMMAGAPIKLIASDIK